MALSREFLDREIGKLQILHGRFANELCNILKRHTGAMLMHSELVTANNLVGWLIDIMYEYNAIGVSSLNDDANALTETEMKNIMDYGYRIMNKYNSELFIPTDSNIYP
jgi:hypothetical protein